MGKIGVGRMKRKAGGKGNFDIPISSSSLTTFNDPLGLRPLLRID